MDVYNFWSYITENGAITLEKRSLRVLHSSLSTISVILVNPGGSIRPECKFSICCSLVLLCMWRLERSWMTISPPDRSLVDRSLAHNTGDWKRSGSVAPLLSAQTSCAAAQKTHSDSLCLVFLIYKMTPNCALTQTHQISNSLLFPVT